MPSPENSLIISMAETIPTPRTKNMIKKGTRNDGKRKNEIEIIWN